MIKFFDSLSGTSLPSILANTAYQLFVKFATSFSTLLVTLLITFFMDIEALGSFTKVVTFVSFFYLLIDFGLNTVLLRENLEDAEKHFGNLLVLRLVYSFVLIMLCVGVVFVLPHNSFEDTGFSNNEKLAVALYSFTILTYGILLTLQVFLQKHLKHNLGLLPQLVGSLALLAIALYAVTTFQFHMLFVAYVFSSLLTVALLFKILKNRFNLHVAVNNFGSYTKKHLFSALPLALILLFSLIHAKADIMLLTYLTDTASVGAYSFSYRIFEFAITLPTLFSASAYPLLLKSQNNTQVFYAHVQKYLMILFAFSMLCLLSLLAVSFLLPSLKDTLTASVEPLQLLALSLPLFFATSILQWVFVIRKRLAFLVILYFFAMIINVALNVVFIPQYSYNASAVITGVTEGIILLAMILFLVIQKVKNT